VKKWKTAIAMSECGSLIKEGESSERTKLSPSWRERERCSFSPTRLDIIWTTIKAPWSIYWTASFVGRKWRSKKALLTLRVGTSSNTVASCATESSGFDYSAEVEMRRAESEGEMSDEDYPDKAYEVVPAEPA
jgi:hypothetical protein